MDKKTSTTVTLADPAESGAIGKPPVPGLEPFCRTGWRENDGFLLGSEHLATAGSLLLAALAPQGGSSRSFASDALRTLGAELVVLADALGGTAGELDPRILKHAVDALAARVRVAAEVADHFQAAARDGAP